MLGGPFTAFDALIAVRDAAHRFKGTTPKDGVDRDRARLEFERAQRDDERRRADAALELELRRQAVDRAS